MLFERAPVYSLSHDRALAQGRSGDPPLPIGSRATASVASACSSRGARPQDRIMPARAPGTPTEAAVGTAATRARSCGTFPPRPRLRRGP